MKTLRGAASFLPMILLGACHGSSQGTAAPTASSSALPSSSASTAAAPAALAPAVAVLPASAALLATLDLAKLASPGVLRALLGAKQPGLEKDLGLAPGTSGAALVTALGLDPARPVTLAQLALGAEGKAAIAALGPIIPHAEPIAHGHPGEVQPEGVLAAVTKALATVPALASYRALLPAKDAARVVDAVGKLFTAVGLKPGAPGEFASRHMLGTVTAVGDVVVVDLVLGDGARDAMNTLRRAPAAGPDEALPLSDAAFAIRYVPERQAEVAFLTGVLTSKAAVSGESVDPKMRERIVNEGLWEASQAFALASSSKGARFATIDLRSKLDPGHEKLTMRAEPGPGYDGPGEAAWGDTYAVSVLGRGAGSAFDLSRTLLDAWPSPAGSGHTMLDTKGVIREVRNLGWSGLWIGLPEVALAFPQALDADALVPPPPILAHFSRFAVSPSVARPAANSAPPVPARRLFIGVLPDGATKASAECALADAAPCPQHKLTSVPVKDGEGWARLAQVDTHFVVLRGATKEAVDGAVIAKSLKGAPAGPVVVDLDVMALAGVDLAGVAPRLAGGVRRDGKTIVAELAAP